MVEAPGITKFEAAEVACRGEAFGVGFGEDDLLAICFGDGGRRGGGCFGFLAGEGGMVEGSPLRAHQQRLVFFCFQTFLAHK